MYVDHHYISTPAIATDVGTMIHAAEESIANQIKDSLFGMSVDYKTVTDTIKEEFKKIKERYPEAIREKDKSDRTYSQKVNFYLETAVHRLEQMFIDNENLVVFGAEQEFDLDYNGYHFHGFIDRIFYDKARDKYIIEDIKTYAVPLENKQLATPLQFIVYTLAFSQMMNIPVEKIECAYDLPFCDMKQPAGTKGFIERGKKKLNELFAAIENDEFEPAPCPLCHWCVFSKTYIEGQPEEAKGLCPYFSHWTRSKKDFSVENEWMGPENDAAIVEAFNKQRNKPQKEVLPPLPDIEVTKIKANPADPTRRFLIRR